MLYCSHGLDQDERNGILAISPVSWLESLSKDQMADCTTSVELKVDGTGTEPADAVERNSSISNSTQSEIRTAILCCTFVKARVLQVRQSVKGKIEL